MKVGDLVQYKASTPRVNTDSIQQGDMGIVIELKPYKSVVMTSVFWFRQGEKWSVPTRDLEIISKSKA